MGFDEWYEKVSVVRHYIYANEKWIAKIGFEAGAASRQAEIDELKSAITKQQIQMLQIQQSCSGCDSRDLLIYELQKQIKAIQKTAQRIMIAIDDDEIEYARRSARKIFKGESNE